MQSYQNHVRLYPPHHYVLMPLAAIALIGSIWNLVPRFRGGTELWPAILLLVASFALALASLLMRGYATKLQDRVVRVEENFRHYILAGTPLDPRLTRKQMIALRFASDAEFVELCSRAVRENLSPDAIKQSIKTWRPDLMRV